ncbi:hypothetical protein ACWD50_27015, partial [Micromonospora sp. NPDC005113]
LQQAVLGFDGDEIWGKELDHLNDGEIDVQCPGCDEELLLDLQSEDSGIEPGLSSELAGRLHQGPGKVVMVSGLGGSE